MTGISPDTHAVPAPSQSIIRSQLANERTFLSWLRTSLACAGGAAAAAHLLPTHEPNATDAALPIALIVLATICLIAGAHRYRSTASRIAPPTEASIGERHAHLALATIAAAIVIGTVALSVLLVR